MLIERWEEYVSHQTLQWENKIICRAIKNRTSILTRGLPLTHSNLLQLSLTWHAHQFYCSFYCCLRWLWRGVHWICQYPRIQEPAWAKRNALPVKCDRVSRPTHSRCVDAHCCVLLMHQESAMHVSLMTQHDEYQYYISKGHTQSDKQEKISGLPTWIWCGHLPPQGANAVALRPLVVIFCGSPPTGVGRV